MLYRKYRPQSFSEVVGQNPIKITIKSQLQNNCVPHAFLFYGPRGIGKTTVARIIAKALNCDKKSEMAGEPCNQCASCAAITAGRSLDVIEIDAASHTKVEEVRETIIAASKIMVAPEKYKVFIVDEVHMLSTSSFNALLKTLEEPPKNVIFILATTEVHKIPETILSRCQRFDFKRIPMNDMLAHLERVAVQEGRAVEREVLYRIARISGGYIRDALSLLGQVLSVSGNPITAQSVGWMLPPSHFESVTALIGALKNQQIKDSLDIINRGAEEGNIGLFMDELLEAIRGLLLVQAGVGEVLDISNNERDVLTKLAGEISKKDLMRMANIFLKRKSEINWSEIEQLPLELGVLEICGDNLATVPPQSEVQTVMSNIVVGEPAKANPNGQIPMTNQISNPNTDGGSNLTEILSQEEISAHWPEALDILKGSNHSLFLLLKDCGELKAVEQNKIILGFGYEFHKEKVMATASRAALENILEKVYHRKVKIEAVVDEMMGKEKEKSSQEKEIKEAALDDVIAAFGGKVVDSV